MSSRIKDEVKKLFEFWCEVKILDNNSAAVISKFPENYQDDKMLETIPKFAFPCEFQITSIQKYSFVLTDMEGKWRFGFCRHDPETQTAMVIVTYLPWHTTFRKLLDIFGQLRHRSIEEFRDFLNVVYKETVPDHGATLNIYYDNRECCFEIQRPPQQYQLPRVLKDHNLTIYYNFVEPKEMIAVFASMLAERRIIFTSSNFERLSCCVQAANEFLYPMQWQHIFIPLLPMKLKDTLMAPMPYLIGVPLPVLNTIPKSELGEVVILNCDTKRFTSPFDDLDAMPPKIVHRMKEEFHKISRPNQDVGDRVSRIFLGALVQMIGGYRSALTYGDKVKWDRDIFVARSNSAHMQEYLKKLVEIQIFNQFIDERLSKLKEGFTDEFEIEILRQAESAMKRKGYKDIFRNVKDKTNPAMKTAVKTVKEGSKTVYKDIKSKIRDINTNQSSHFHSHISNSHHSGMDTLSQTSMSCDFSSPSSPINSKKYFSQSSPVSNNSSDEVLSSNFVHLHPNGVSNDSPSQNLSPASSFGSLNFNLTQELQDHPLFQSPKVDQSLKPSSSFDMNQGKSGRCQHSSAPAIIPRSNTTAAKPAQKSTFFVNDSVIDKPPTKPTPPVPPRRHHNNVASSTNDLIKLETNCNNNVDRTDYNNLHMQLATKVSHELVLMKNNNVINNQHNPHLPLQRTSQQQQQRQISIMQQTQIHHHHFQHNNSIIPQMYHRNVVKEVVGDEDEAELPPIPTPRSKKESPSAALPPSGGDLMQLDVSDDSFEVQDFDPLNPNARPFNEKIYPPPSTNSSSKIFKNDDDSKLLSLYGLDDFLPPATTHVAPPSTSVAATVKTSNWTTFD